MAERKTFVLSLMAGRGDTLMARPVLRGFRKAHPRDVIYFECAKEFQGLLHGQTDADFVGETGKWKGARAERIELWDRDLAGMVKERIHLMDAMARKAGVWPLSDRNYGFFAPASDDRWAAEEAAKLGSFACFHSASSLPSKDWPARNWTELARHVKKDFGLAPVQIGGESDPPIGGAADYRGKLSLERLGALLSRAQLFCGPDSMPMHLSRGEHDVPALVVWGASDPIVSGLFGPKVANLQPARRDCAHAGQSCFQRCDWKRPCAEDVSVEDAYLAASRLIRPDPSAPDVTFVLLNWNSWASHTFQTLEALNRTCRSNWDFVLVDNGSERDQDHLATFSHPKLSARILFPENRGVPVAWNAAARVAKGRAVCLLNTDIDILKEGWDREALDKMASRPLMGILGVSANEPPRLFGPEWDAIDLPVPPEEGALTRCHHVNGSCMFVTRECLDKVGPFDEGFTPGYSEETDFCLRAGLAGIEVSHLSGFVRHRGHEVVVKNRMKAYEHVTRNVTRFKEKWAGSRAPGIPIDGPQVMAAANA